MATAGGVPVDWEATGLAFEVDGGVWLVAAKAEADWLMAAKAEADWRASNFAADESNLDCIAAMAMMMEFSCRALMDPGVPAAAGPAACWFAEPAACWFAACWFAEVSPRREMTGLTLRGGAFAVVSPGGGLPLRSGVLVGLTSRSSAESWVLSCSLPVGYSEGCRRSWWEASVLEN